MQINQEKRRNKRHKNTAEEFTPISLVNEMLNKLPQELFTDPSKKFIDPACGNGNFCVEILKRRMKHMTPLEAISNIYGCDIMKDNIRELRERMYSIIPKKIMTIKNIKEVIRCLLNHFLYVEDALNFNFCFPSKQSNENITLFYNNHNKTKESCIIDKNRILNVTKLSSSTNSQKANSRRIYATAIG